MNNKAINEFGFRRISRIRQPTQPHSLVAKIMMSSSIKNDNHPMLTKFESLVSSGAQKVSKEIENR